MDLLNHTRWLISSPGEGICPRCVREAALGDEEALRAAHPMKARQAQALAARIASARALTKAKAGGR
jgi:hypothetical protein